MAALLSLYIYSISVVGGIEARAKPCAQHVGKWYIGPAAMSGHKFLNASLERIPTSQRFRAILDNAPERYVTPAWLFESLHERSFGMVMLILGLLAILPGISLLAGPLVLAIGFQMMMAYPVPVLPRFIARRSVSTSRMARMIDRSTPVIHALEKIVRPRWRTPFVVTKRVVGFIVSMLAVTLFMPVPLSNVIPGLLVMLIAIAYLEEDGLLLSIALCAAVPSLAITWMEGWVALQGANFLFQL